jgi:diguanylate cyclase (GGDEF)-like protein
VAERTRAALEAHEFDLDGKRTRVTASFGVAGRRSSYSGFEQMIVAADEVLYRAKQSGRNQVWVADENGRQAGPCPRSTPATNPQ